MKFQSALVCQLRNLWLAGNAVDTPPILHWSSIHQHVRQNWHADGCRDLTFPHCRPAGHAKSKGSICLLYKWADTAFLPLQSIADRRHTPRVSRLTLASLSCTCIGYIFNVIFILKTIIGEFFDNIKSSASGRIETRIALLHVHLCTHIGNIFHGICLLT